MVKEDRSDWVAVAPEGGADGGVGPPPHQTCQIRLRLLPKGERLRHPPRAIVLRPGRGRRLARTGGVVAMAESIAV